MHNISVVIPVKNEVSKIKACIDGILNQTIKVKEIIVIDSGSTDGTINILKQYQEVKLIEIPGEEFNHGETRNLGVSHATGEYVLLTVGDARPYNEHWIENMLKGFVDESVAGVCGKQVVPHDTDKNPAEWYRPMSKGSIVKFRFTDDAFEKLSPAEKKHVCSWDDVTAMYKRDVLLKLPFRRTSYSEDAIWAKDALLNGYAIVYNPEAIVYHYHLENEDFTFKRSLTTFYFRYKHFQYIYPPVKRSVMDILRTAKVIFQSEGLSIGQKIHWFRYNSDIFSAIQKAHIVFTEALAKGEEELDAIHSKYCGKPPIPSKK